jgi:8-hydroxy-5-deazaflavin:NADPH oxidoreductase
MPHISIFGSGRVSTALATKFASAGHAVTLGVRNVEEASAKWRGPPVSFKNPADAARAAPVVFNATPGDTSLDRLSALREPLDGKILIDVSNATLRGADGMPGRLMYPNDSLAEHLQKALPHTFVVKTLNTMLFTVMTNPGALSSPPTAFISGDDADAKEIVKRLLADLGWKIEWIEDLGGILTARGTEAIALLVPSIIRTRGLAPFAFGMAR